MDILSFAEYTALVESMDKVAVDELVLYIENDGDLYRQRTSPIIANMKRKFKKGTYDAELAVKAYMYLVDDGAKKYAKEFGDGVKWNIMFPKAERMEAAKQLEAKYKEEVEFEDEK